MLLAIVDYNSKFEGIIQKCIFISVKITVTSIGTDRIDQLMQNPKFKIKIDHLLANRICAAKIVVCKLKTDTDILYWSQLDFVR